jgi:hypothetical protein
LVLHYDSTWDLQLQNVLPFFPTFSDEERGLFFKAEGFGSAEGWQ